MNQDKKITVIGEILAEIMAETTGDGFKKPISLIGPFPSGAPAIFIDQVAKLGQSCAIVSSVGDDDFGHLNIERLIADGVDTKGIAIDPDRPTGTSFVRYRENGDRDFVFNIQHSACGNFEAGPTARSVLDQTDHFHVMGSSLSSQGFISLNVETARAVKERGGTVSFDPNIRKELLDRPGLKEAMLTILDLTDLFLPSGDELLMLCGTNNVTSAIDRLLGSGISSIVHKNGSKGSRYIGKLGDFHQPTFSVAEIDPTGAGDCFGGTFTTLWLQGMDIQQALELSSAAGAFAVTRQGPMEGTSNMTELRKFMKVHS